MTTVVYDHKRGHIAIDSRISAGSLICSDEGVKFMEKDGCVWFFCGTTADYSKLASLSHDDKPEIKPDASAIMVKDGDVWLICFNGDYCCHCKLEQSRAIGSGADFALASLDHGRSAEDAIKYAMTRDSGTGGKVHTYDVGTGRFI